MDHNTYQSDFMKALEKSIAWKQIPDSSRHIPKEFPTAAESLLAYKAAAEHIPFDDYRVIRNNCLAVHHSLWMNLGKHYPCFVTMGDVEVEGVLQFGTSYQQLKRETRGVHKGTNKKFDAHIWLTFQDMHIIDLTFFFWKFWERLPEKWVWSDYVICSSDPFALDLPLRYRPMLISPHLMVEVVDELQPALRY